MTVRFKCLWHAADLCPKRYIVVVRGPTIYSPALTDMEMEAGGTVVTVKLRVPEPGHYELFAWPDFETCPHHWRDNMKYPVNRGQVMGTPAPLVVTGPPAVTDALGPCSLAGSESNGRSPGRWIAKDALRSRYGRAAWATSFPQKQHYIYQPYGCKRPHRTAAAAIDRAPSVKNILFVGDSVTRGAFCSQVWPQLSASHTADGNCKFVNDAVLYHAAPKDMQYTTPDHRTVGLAFRFVDDHPNNNLEKLAMAGASSPSHIVANLGLWLAPFTTAEYEAIMRAFLQNLYRLYPSATVVWRTTTDVAPMIQCFSDKGMTRSTVFEQREVSLAVVRELRDKGMRIYVVDAYAMTATRPDACNDGRHWVIESPEEYSWLPQSRPAANDAEAAVLDAVWDIIVLDDQQPRQAQLPAAR